MPHVHTRYCVLFNYVNYLGQAAHQGFQGCVMNLGIIRQLTMACYWCTLLSEAADGQVVEYAKC
jgi:hypothetical protein